jgi:hypothetical protein
LRGKRRAALLPVKSSEKWVVFAIEDAAGMHAVGEHLRERTFANANRTFNDNVAWGFECRNGLQLLCGGWQGAEL